jgi:methylmalonyl-CoA mutase
MAPLEIVGRISFRLVADQNQFLTIAKLRAFRRLWTLVLNAWGIPAVPAFVHAETAWGMQTKRDPWVNILRSTIATFAAAVGGADAITTIPHTAVVGEPDKAARRLARNLQSILLEECNLHRVADPAAGAGGIEELTDALASAAWAEFQQIDREGGLIASINGDHITARIRTVAEARRQAVAKRRIPITGTSTYPLLSERQPKVDPGPPMAPPGEGLTRDAEPWEALRDRSDAALASGGRRPAVFLANLGPVAAFTGRATWAKNLFEAGGLEAVGRDGFDDLSELARVIRAGALRIVCLCSDDRTYETLGAKAVAAVREAGADLVLLAGRPKEIEAQLVAAGVDRFVHEGLDMLDLLGALHDHLGTPAATTV